MVLACLGGFLGFLAVGFMEPDQIHGSHWIYQWVLLTAVGGSSVVVYPQARAYISIFVEPVQQGTVLCVLSILETCVEVAMPILAGLLYKATIKTAPATCFLVFALLCLLSLILALRLRCCEAPTHVVYHRLYLPSSAPSSSTLTSPGSDEDEDEDGGGRDAASGAVLDHNDVSINALMKTDAPLSGDKKLEI